MATTLTPSPVRQGKNLFSAISWAALLVGTLDITAAMTKFYLERDLGPSPIFKFISSGVFGRQAFTGGTLMIIWGLVFHYIITFLFTTFLFLIYPRLSTLLKNKYVIGILYGLFIWVIMNRIIVPLSNTPVSKAGFDARDAIIQALILITMIGIPASWLAHRYYYPASPDKI